MSILAGKSIVVKSGRFKGKTFHVEGTIEEVSGAEPGYGRPDLPYLALKGNFAARNAIDIDKYTAADEPFYYGKIGSLGYVIAEKDLVEKP